MAGFQDWITNFLIPTHNEIADSIKAATLKKYIVDEPSFSGTEITTIPSAILTKRFDVFVFYDGFEQLEGEHFTVTNSKITFNETFNGHVKVKIYHH